MKLNVSAFALSLGILWGVGCLFMGLVAIVCSWAKPFVDALGILYVGYSATIIGSLIGTVWGFIDGWIGGAIFALLYNVIAEKMAK